MGSKTRALGAGLRALGLAVLAVLPLAASAGDAMDRILRRDQIIVGYRDDSPPFSFVVDGRPMGYSIDLCMGIVERIRAELGKPQLPFRLVPVPSDQMIRVVSTGGVDLLCAGTSDTEERRASIAFSTPIFITAAKFMVRARDGITAAKQLQGQTVAVVARTTAEGATQAYSQKNGLALKVSPALNPDAAIGQLVLGHAKAYLRDEVMLLNQRALQKQPADYIVLPEEVSEEVNAIALPKGDPLLQKAVDQGLALQVRSGRAAALYEQWFVKPHAGSAEGLKLPMPAPLKAEFDRLR
jgi:glutamate/aspartate transport system substrate-binding protein